MPNPQYRDSVWYQNEGSNAGRNGTIVHIDWHDKEIIVRFDDGEEALEWDQFDNFNERFNQWQVHR